MSYNPCDYPTMRELYKIKEDIAKSQEGMTLRERSEDIHRRGKEALVNLGLTNAIKPMTKH